MVCKDEQRCMLDKKVPTSNVWRCLCCSCMRVTNGSRKGRDSKSIAILVLWLASMWGACPQCRGSRLPLIGQGITWRYMFCIRDWRRKRKAKSLQGSMVSSCSPVVSSRSYCTRTSWSSSPGLSGHLRHAPWPSLFLCIEESRWHSDCCHFLLQRHSRLGTMEWWRLCQVTLFSMTLYTESCLSCLRGATTWKRLGRHHDHVQGWGMSLGQDRIALRGSGTREEVMPHGHNVVCPESRAS